MNDCFDKILELNSNSDETKYKVIIELMKDLEDGISNALRIRNCLLILINLYFEQKHCDYTDLIGKSSQDLSDDERIQMYQVLKWEFNN
ncbi:MAG: hypothetical protein ACFFA0_03525 [Promethearchaeota archaeon]